MNVYHITYDPSSASIDIHFWTDCNLKCKACYVPYNPFDFGLFDDPIAVIDDTKFEKPPAKFLSLDDIMGLLDPLVIKSAVFIGTEPSIDPDMPTLAKALRDKFCSYNILLTNGYKLANLDHINEIIFSIKAVSPNKHIEYTGRNNNCILNNFRSLYENGVKLQVETVFIPGFIDADEIKNIAQFISEIDTNIPFRIDAFFPVPGCKWRAASRQEVEHVTEIAKEYLSTVHFLTLDMKRIGEKASRLY